MRLGHAGRATVIAVDLLERFRSKYPFPLDDFQVEAARAIAAGQSVIVSAPTGAGKTLVAEFAIDQALETGKRVARSEERRVGKECRSRRALQHSRYSPEVRTRTHSDRSAQ